MTSRWSPAGLDLAVIVPCYNVSDTLAEQLNALVSQEWRGSWEIVVVDNGSTDRTATIAHKFEADCGRLRVIAATDGQSVAYARNAGARSTGAQSIAFCDGDDVVRPGWVAAMGEALKTEQLVSGRVDASQINEAWLASTRPDNSADRLPMFGHVAFARGCNCGMSRTLWEQLGGYDEAFRGLEDIEFSLRAAAVGVQAALVSEAVVDYRYRPGIKPLWKQGFFYGRGTRELRRRAADLELKGPPRSRAFKSWLWLFAKLPTLHRRSGRYAWLWVLSNRLGAIRGAFDRRT